MSYSQFYDTTRLEQVAINLFYGWGYNFYKLENQLRADDLLVRSHVSSILGNARQSANDELAAFRRTYLPLPTREKPMPDPDAVAKAEYLQSVSNDLGQIEGAIRAMPVPEDDRMTQRYRQEADTLTRLRDFDTRLVGQAEAMRQLMAQGYDWMLNNRAVLREGIRLMKQTIEERQYLLR